MTILRSNAAHCRSLGAGMWDMRKSGRLVDVSIHCHGHSTRAHRIVLSVFSPILRASLVPSFGSSSSSATGSDRLPPSPSPSSLTGINGEVLPDALPTCLCLDEAVERALDLEILLEFLYRGEVALPEDAAAAAGSLDSLLRTAKCLQIASLVEAIRNVDIDTTNAAGNNNNNNDGGGKTSGQQVEYLTVKAEPSHLGLHLQGHAGKVGPKGNRRHSSTTHGIIVGDESTQMRPIDVEAAFASSSSSSSSAAKDHHRHAVDNHSTDVYQTSNFIVGQQHQHHHHHQQQQQQQMLGLPPPPVPHEHHLHQGHGQSGSSAGVSYMSDAIGQSIVVDNDDQYGDDDDDEEEVEPEGSDVDDAAVDDDEAEFDFEDYGECGEQEESPLATDNRHQIITQGDNMATVSGGGNGSRPSKRRRFKCKLTCNKVFFSRRGYMAHVKSHSVPSRCHRCPMCAFITGQKWTLINHLAIVHKKSTSSNKVFTVISPAVISNEKAREYLAEAETGRLDEFVNDVPAIKPSGGELLLFRASSKSDDCNYLRDGYNFWQLGNRVTKELGLRRIYFKLHRGSRQFAEGFSRYVFKLTAPANENGQYVLVHYVGDESVYEPVSHGNSREIKNSKTLSLPSPSASSSTTTTTTSSLLCTVDIGDHEPQRHQQQQHHQHQQHHHHHHHQQHNHPHQHHQQQQQLHAVETVAAVQTITSNAVEPANFNAPVRLN